MNIVILVGNLGVDPEVKFTPQGTAKASFRIATNETYTDKSGERQTKTEWHNIIAWGKVAELCGKYISKGSSVLVEGKISYREWDKKDGAKAYITEVVAQNVKFLDKATKSESSNQHNKSNLDDIPF